MQTVYHGSTHRLCIVVGVKRENDSRCARQSAEALAGGGEEKFKRGMRFNTRCKCNPAKSEQRRTPDMRHMLVPVGKQARVKERGDIEGSYPAFCYSAADSFDA